VASGLPRLLVLPLLENLRARAPKIQNATVAVSAFVGYNRLTEAILQ